MRSCVREGAFENATAFGLRSIAGYERSSAFGAQNVRSGQWDSNTGDPFQQYLGHSACFREPLEVSDPSGASPSSRHPPYERGSSPLGS